MKLKSLEPANGLDRLATCDEIRTAMALFPDSVLQVTDEAIFEIPSDRGGYVRIQAEEFEFLSLFDELDQIVK